MSLYTLYLHFVVYPYSLIFCLRYLPLRQAIHIPILIAPSVKIGKMKRGRIVLTKCHRSMVIIGLPGTEGRGQCRSLLSVHRGGRLVFHGSATMAKGTRVVVDHGEMEVGEGFFCNCDSSFYCTQHISIGPEALLGWNVNMNTTNGHRVFDNGVEKPMEGDIHVGCHVWIGSWANIAKSTSIADGCIVAQSSLVGGGHDTPNTLIAGMPAKDIKNNYTWKG